MVSQPETSISTSKLEGRLILPAPVVMPVGVTLSIWMATAGKLSGSHPLYSPRARPWSTPSASLGPPATSSG